MFNLFKKPKEKVTIVKLAMKMLEKDVDNVDEFEFEKGVNAVSKLTNRQVVDLAKFYDIAHYVFESKFNPLIDTKYFTEAELVKFFKHMQKNQKLIKKLKMEKFREFIEYMYMFKLVTGTDWDYEGKIKFIKNWINLSFWKRMRVISLFKQRYKSFHNKAKAPLINRSAELLESCLETMQTESQKEISVAGDFEQVKQHNDKYSEVLATKLNVIDEAINKMRVGAEISNEEVLEKILGKKKTEEQIQQEKEAIIEQMKNSDNSTDGVMKRLWGSCYKKETV